MGSVFFNTLFILLIVALNSSGATWKIKELKIYTLSYHWFEEVLISQLTVKHLTEQILKYFFKKQIGTQGIKNSTGHKFIVILNFQPNPAFYTMLGACE